MCESVRDTRSEIEWHLRRQELSESPSWACGPSLASERSSMDIVTSLVEWVGDDSDYVFNEHESIGVKEGA